MTPNTKPKYELYIPKTKDDRERALLPTLIYAGDIYEQVKVQIIVLGWWKWGIALKRVVNTKPITKDKGL